MTTLTTESPQALHRGTGHCTWCGQDHEGDRFPVLNRNSPECWPLPEGMELSRHFDYDEEQWTPWKRLAFIGCTLVAVTMAGLLVWGAVEAYDFTVAMWSVR